MNAENVNVLLDQNRFNLDILPHLEAYLQHQLDSRSYHLEANLALLKFYQFHPEKAQKLITARIVAKALMQLPANDFSLCMYQIPERFHTEEPVLSLQNLASLLETSHFSEFWTESRACGELLNSVPGFDDAFRGFIVSVIAQSYRSISKTALSELLNVKGSELDSLIVSQSWEQNSENVVIPRIENTFLQAKKKISQSIKHEDLSRIMKTLSK